MELIYNYNERGYYHAKSALSKEFCKVLLNKINELPPKVFLPFSGTPWGYGQLFDVNPFDKILTNPILTKFCESLYNTKDYKVNHLLVSNKVAWIGPEEMYHQEVSNIDTFAPGASAETDWREFLQVFIALENQTLENGCLRIIPKSHKLGILEHEDIVWNHTGHKRRVKSSELKKAYEGGGILNCEINQGDILFFNHRLVHGSSSNQSPFDRKAVIMQVQNNVKEKDMVVFEKESTHRTNFFINWMKDKTSSIINKDMYGDFNKKS
jgi:hypothetical protein